MKRLAPVVGVALLLGFYVFAQSLPPSGGTVLSGVTIGTTQTISGAKTLSSTLTSSVGSGSNAIAFSTSGARLDLGAGSVDYLSSDGNNLIVADTKAYWSLSSGTYNSQVSNGTNAIACANLGCRYQFGDSNTYIAASSSFNLQVGDGSNTGLKSGSFTSGSGQFYAASGSAIDFRGQAADGAGSKQVLLRSQNAVSNATANVVAVQNGSTDVMYIDKDGAPQLNLAGGGSQPTCSASHRGKLWFTASGASTADKFEVCAKTSSDTYAWTAVATPIP